MSESFKTLLKYMGYLANIQIYDSWDNKFKVKEYNKNRSNTKEQFKEDILIIDFSEITDEEYKLLRFCDFDENFKNLIPFWLFEILPDDTKLICFNEDKKLKKDADNDTRFGCTAYKLDLD